MIAHAEIAPLPAVDWGGGEFRDITLLQLSTPDGLTGLGSAYTGVGQVRDALTLYERDPQTLLSSAAETTIAMSAIDIALWDIRGKKENQPVSELLGGRQRDRVLAYVTVGLPMPAGKAGDAFEKILRLCMEKGFRAIKLCIEGFGRRDNKGSDNERDRRDARALEFARKIVGKDIQLMLDVYGSDSAWSPELDWAIKTAKVLQDLDFLWFEEPLSPRSIDDFVRLTQLSDIAIAGAEDFVLLHDFQNIANLKAVNILQPDCTRVGGLTQMQAIRNAATENNLHVIPHGWNSAVGLAADLHFQSTVADDRYCMVEFRSHQTITDLLENKPFALDNEGKIAVPTGPGLGVALNDAFQSRI